MAALLGRTGSLERENDPERVRIVPALRGQIAVLRRERRTLEDEFQSRLADIAARAPVAESLQLVSAALLLPAPGPAE